MILKMTMSVLAMSALWLCAPTARANIQSNRWFYDMMQDGRDVHITLQLIEEEPPNFDTTFKLTRGDDVLFEGKQFVREEADEKVGPEACIEDSQADGPIADCDGDGAADCAGVCGTAYRYRFVDVCVPNDHPMYNLYDEENPDGDSGPYQEGIYYIFDLQETDDDCLDDTGSCSVSAIGGSASDAKVAVLVLMAGLGFFSFVRRRKTR